MQTGEAPVGWDSLSAAVPDAVVLAAVEAADPALLPPAGLVDALRCCERLLSHIAGLQASLLTEFARPGRSGDISRIVAATVDVDGAATRSDGQVDTDALTVIVDDHARGMAAAELAAALSISPITARYRVDAAVDLCQGLPGTHRALTQGVLDRGRAALIAECTSTLEPELRLDVEQRILPLVGGRTAGRLRPLIGRAVLIADPDTTSKRIAKARRGREVTHRPIKDQLSVINAVLPADGAVTVFTLIDVMAGSTKTAGDDRSVAERRADALTDLATELLTHGRLDLRGMLNPAHTTDEDTNDEDTDDGNSWYDADPADPATTVSAVEVTLPDGRAGNETATHLIPATPDDNAVTRQNARPPAQLPSSQLPLTRQGRRPHLTVTMSLSTLMALDQLPGHLQGYGAITAELAAAITAAAASVTVAVINPATGTPEHASARFGYRPSQHQRDIVTTLADTCRFPSCRQPAWRCDLDHRDAYDHNSPHTGGPTCPCNLDPHCRRHHALKHHADWTAHRTPDGAMNWTSPTGHHYTDPPTELTLPGELHHRPDTARTTITTADHEHTTQCAEPPYRDQPTPTAVHIHHARRRAMRAQILERIRSAQQPRPLRNPGTPEPTDSDSPHPDAHPDPALINAARTTSYQRTTTSALTDLQRRTNHNTTTPLPDNDHPPF